jgi:excisionase family DNA binding protein
MTLPAFAKKIESRLPSVSEREVANQLRSILAASAEDEAARLKGPSGADIVLLPGVTNLLLEVLRHIGNGDAVTIVPVTQMLTTQQAADILNVSRPFLISLLEKGEIRFELVGRHRRIRADDLFAYKRSRDDRRSKALSDLAGRDADLI